MTLQEVMIKRIHQVNIRYLDSEQHVLIANSEGKFVEDMRIYSRLAIQAMATEGNEMQNRLLRSWCARWLRIY